MKEIWKDIPGHEGYQVSSLANVRSIDRVITDRNGVKYNLKGKQLSPGKHPFGYYTINIGGVSQRTYSLYALAFIPNPKGYSRLKFIDGDPSNISKSNLKWTDGYAVGKDVGSFKHGIPRKHPLWGTYSGMKSRCYNPKVDSYKHYGARGITVCDEWLNDFLTFYNWSISNGWKRGLSLDRKDNDQGYSPENCRWATNQQQSLNRRNNVVLTHNGKTQTVSEWALELNINPFTVYNRLDEGKSTVEALSSKPLINKWLLPNHGEDDGLTEEDISFIRNNRLKGSRTKLAEQFGISTRRIDRIRQLDPNKVHREYNRKNKT